MVTGRGKFLFGAAAFLLGCGAAFIAAAAPDFPTIPGPGRGGPPAYLGVPGVPGRDAGPPSIPNPYPQVGPQRNDARDYRDVPNDPFAIDSINAIDSADSCKLNEGAVYVSATGSCPGGKSCVLQERRKGSIQAWKQSAANPNPVESQNEYRPDCI
jgi:hypothetical protein